MLITRSSSVPSLLDVGCAGNVGDHFGLAAAFQKGQERRGRCYGRVKIILFTVQDSVGEKRRPGVQLFAQQRDLLGRSKTAARRLMRRWGPGH